MRKVIFKQIRHVHVLTRALKIRRKFHDGFKNSLKKNQVLVKIFYSGICGSQIGEINAVKGKDKFLPHLLGHEATGKVVKTYDKNSKFKTGNIVILHWQKSKLTDSQLPVYYDSNKNRINAGWVTTFNNYAVISENRLTKLL